MTAYTISTLFSAAAILALAAPREEIHRLALADCDDLAFGPQGDLYFACHSPGDSLPVTVRGAKTTPDVMDAYVLRVRPKTGEIVFATRLGGSAFDAGLRIVVDDNGDAYTTGLTKSPDFPNASAATQHKLRGSSDAFLAKISSTGEVIDSALFGGNGDEIGNALTVGKDGTVYLGGSTSSSDFPLMRNRKASTADDAFVCRIQITMGTSQCTVFGGNKAEKLTGLALDPREGIYAVGYTASADFPTKHPLQKRLRGSSDLFLSRFAVPSLKMTFSTVFGGSGDDSGWGVAVDNEGNPVVTGITDSGDLPVTVGSYQTQRGGKKDAFVAVFGGPDHKRVRVTYFGGAGDDESGYDGGNVTVDRNGTVWLAGVTYSDDLPVRNAVQKQYGGGEGDGFVAAFNSDLTRLCVATYIGDKDRNLLEGVAVSASGTVAATGVSFRDSPSPFHVQLGPKLYAGHNTVLLNGDFKCDQ